MQAYDSVYMEVDLEVGGTDQTFNMLAGRHLMKALKNKEKFILTVPLLIGTDGQKMGKSAGNFISITASPDDMFGQVMSIRDDLLQQYFELCTDIDLKSVNLSQPMQAKKSLAFEIVKTYHGEKAAKTAQAEFETVHQKGELPQDTETQIEEGTSLIDALTKLTTSKSQTKRLLNQGAVEIDGKTAHDGKIKLQAGQILKVGKKRFVRIK